MSSAVSDRRTRATEARRATRDILPRLMRAALALIMVAGSLGLATTTATAQTNGDVTDDAADGDAGGAAEGAADEGADGDAGGAAEGAADGDAGTDDDGADDAANDGDAGGAANGGADGGDAGGAATDDAGDDAAGDAAGDAANDGDAGGDIGEVVCPTDTGPLPFTDVDPGNFAYDDIRCLLELGITQLSSNGNLYRPLENVTREEMAAFMARTYRAVTGTDAESVETPFTDVPEGSFAVDDIARIYGLGITTGTTPTTFSPAAPVRRSHMALFLTRLYKAVWGSLAPVVSTDFTDISQLDPEQQTAIAQIYGLGVTTGTSPTTFAPNQPVTRAQMGSFIARLYKKLAAATAPTGVTARPSGDGTELTVAWTPTSNAASGSLGGYVVQWKSDDEDYAVTRQQSTRAASTTITGLTRGTEYTLRVAAVVAQGTGPWSADTTGIPATAPGPVSEFNVEPGNTELILTWQPPLDDGGSDITGYVVRWAADRRAEPSEHAVEDPNVQTHTITGLRNTTSDDPSAYYVWITAVNSVGDGPRTPASAGGPVSPTTVSPGPPTELAVNAVSTSGTELVVEWRAPLNDGGEPVDSYRIERKCADGSGSTGWGTSGIPGNPPGRVDVANVVIHTTTVTGLENGRPCEVRVRAVNANSSPRGPWSWASATAVPIRVPGPPTLNASGVLSADQALHVAWTPPADTGGSSTIGYEISYASGGPSEQITVAGTVTSATIPNLYNDSDYTVSVRAVSAAGTGRRSAVVTATPKAVPAAPRNLVARPPRAVDSSGNRVVVDPESLLVTWDPPASNGTNEVLGYVFEYRESHVAPSSPGTDDGTPAGDWTEVALTPPSISNSSVTISGLKDRRFGSATGRGVSFDVRVRATNDHDGDSGSADSTPVEGGPWAVTSATPATQPAGIGSAAGGHTDVDVETGFRLLTVSWNPPDDGGAPITHYLLNYFERGSGVSGPDIRVDAPATRHTITGLDDRTVYTLTIRAVNAVGAGTDSFEISGFTSSVPSAPATVTATMPTLNSDGVPGDGTELTVDWSAVVEANGGFPIIGYEVQYRRLAEPDRPVPGDRYPPHAWQTVDGDLQSARTDFPLGTLTAKIRGLDAGAAYSIRVRAVTEAESKGTSGYAAIVKTVGIPTDLSIVSVRINDAASTERHNTKVVTWESSGQGLEGVTSYKVRWFPSEAGGSGSSGEATVAVGTHTYAITGLAAGTYVAKVSACNSVGCTGEVLSSYDTRTRSGDKVTVR